MENQVDTDVETQMILLAAANHDLEALRALLRTGSANVQDPDTGYTPLHAAIAACEPDTESHSVGEKARTLNGHTNGEGEVAEDSQAPDVEAAAKTLKLLFQNGAIWNDLDNNGETPGCIAHRLGLKELYEIVVDAGVRAELLLNRLDEYEPLGDTGDDDEEENEAETTDFNDANGAGIDPTDTPAIVVGTVPPEPSAEQTETSAQETQPDVNNADYLSSTLRFSPSRLLDADNNGVMMAWETDIMRRSAELLLPTPGLRVLNVGHGMGIIDGFFQAKSPAAHHIVEAHPAVLERMRKDGWYEKQGVTVHEGRWQDVVPKLVEEGVVFDAIYFDTFAEEYKALRTFFSEYAVELLDSKGRFGFFNGLGADRQVCYDVYTKIVEMDLFEAGFDTEWENIPVPDLQNAGEWNGVRRPYWVPDTYRVPTCTLIG